MSRTRKNIKTRVTEHIAKHRQAKKHLSSSALFIAIALAIGFGYVAGTYHYQIEAVIGPVFGYKAHSGTIDLSSLQQTYNELAANYDGKLDMTKLIQGANSGLVDAVDDTYTTYMTPIEATSFDNTLTGDIGGGIGAEIGLKNNKITIMNVLDNNPAKVAGLFANDIILDINDQSTTGWTVDRAVNLIRGDEGTTVKLTIQRGTETTEYTVTRAIINNPSVTSSVSGDLGTITITRFDDETGNLARVVAQNFKKQGVKAVILDLRNNGGGYVSAAQDVASLWLNNKIVVTERNDGKIKNTLRSDSDAILAGIPTVVLVNGASASASEIVAGALQDYKVATIVGENTFGKGSVQKLISLDGGAELKVTVARWYTPNGKNITNGGIKPDTTATLTQADVDNSIDPQVNAAKKILGL
jgi:carboxyl-terminal processing protease